MIVPVYIPTDSVGGFPFLYTLSSIYFLGMVLWWLSDQGEVIVHCVFIFFFGLFHSMWFIILYIYMSYLCGFTYHKHLLLYWLCWSLSGILLWSKSSLILILYYTIPIKMPSYKAQPTGNTLNTAIIHKLPVLKALMANCSLGCSICM